MNFKRFMLKVLGFLGTGILVQSLAWASPPWKPRMSIPAMEPQLRTRIQPLPIEKPNPQALRAFWQHYQKGQDLFRLGKYKDAQVALSKAASLYPTHVGASYAHARTLLTLGYLTWNQGNIQEAYNLLQETSKIHPKNLKIKLLANLTERLLDRMRFVRPTSKESNPPLGPN